MVQYEDALEKRISEWYLWVVGLWPAEFKKSLEESIGDLILSSSFVDIKPVCAGLLLSETAFQWFWFCCSINRWYSKTLFMSGIIKKLSRLNGIIRKDCGKLSLRKTAHMTYKLPSKKNRQPETKYQLDLVDLRFGSQKIGIRPMKKIKGLGWSVWDYENGFLYSGLAQLNKLLAQFELYKHIWDLPRIWSSLAPSKALSDKFAPSDNFLKQIIHQDCCFDAFGPFPIHFNAVRQDFQEFEEEAEPVWVKNSWLLLRKKDR